MSKNEGEAYDLEYHGVRTRIFLPNADDLIQSGIRSSRTFYEIDMLRDIGMRVEADSLAIDVGANIGNHTLFLAQHLGLRVVAFEPHADLFDLLSRNVRANGLEERVEMHNVGLGAEAHESHVEAGSAANLGQTMLLRSGAGPSVPVRRLDDFEFDRPIAVLKIDVEGMELEVLRGAERHLRESRPLLYVEAQAPHFLAEVEHFLLRYDYVVIDRYNSTPTYLFAAKEHAEQERLTTIHKRLAEMHRDLRLTADRIAGGRKAVDSLRDEQEKRRRAEERTLSTLGGQMERALASLDSLETLARERDGDWVEHLAGQLAERLEPDAAHEHELRRLRFINEKYRKKIEVLLESASWKSMQPLRSVGSAIANRGKPDQPMTAEDFFKKVQRQADSIRRPNRRPKRRRLRARSSRVEVGPVGLPKETLPPARLAARSPESPRSTRVLAAVAAIPERRAALEQMVASILPQVDRLCVYLNGFEDVPAFLRKECIEIARSQDHGDRGDAGKFYWVDDFDGFYFTCDDDIIYCSDYVQRSLAKLRQYEYGAVVGWHGSLIREPFEDYYTRSSRRVLSFEFDRPWDTPAHVLGTGCTAFHTSTIRVKHSDFPTENMADVYFAALAQEQRVPLIVVEHRQGDLTAIESAQASSINLDSRKQRDSRKNTRERQNRIVAARAPWTTFEFAPLRVLLVGRFATYSKGGIFKSCHLIAEKLRERGHDVTTQDTTEPLMELPQGLDLAWIYPGDPHRPDYSSVDGKIRSLQKAGIVTLVNFSYIDLPERSQWIAEQLAQYNTAGATPVFAAVFADSVQDDPILRDWTSHLLMVPKTISVDEIVFPTFEEREGICFGDATKLSNETIIGGPSAPWIDACSRRLPHVSFYAYKQYSGQDPHPRLSLAPHMDEGFGPWLASRRLFVCLNRHLTFEMVACEAQRVGVPVLYRHMRHSLSEYVGPTGLRVRGPEELGELCAWLYEDANAWSQFSQASALSAAGLDVDLHGANLEASLRLALFRARQLSQSSPSR